MTILESLRKLLIRKGFRNVDSVISMTGFNNYKINEVWKGGPNNHIKSIRKALRRENKDLLYQSLKFGYKNFGIAGHVIKTQGWESLKILEKTPSENFWNVANSIDGEGPDAVKQAISLNVPQNSIEIVAKAINSAGFETVKKELEKIDDEKVKTKARGIVEKYRKIENKNLSKALELFKGEISVALVKNPVENIKIIEKNLMETEKNLKNKNLNYIPREKLLNMSKGWKLYNKEVENFIGDKNNYSLNDINFLKNKLVNSIRANKIKKKGVSIFPAVFEVKKTDTYNKFIFSFYPTPEDFYIIKTVIMVKTLG
jgi:hypothetical protein